jgi:NitT/TauT family transport system substrate-binding protein
VLGGPESIVAMANGSIDALVIVEPFFSQVEQNGSGRRVLGAVDITPNITGGMLLMSPQLRAQNPAAAQRFVVAWLRGVRDYLDAFVKYQDQDAAVAFIRSSQINYVPIAQTPSFDPNGRFDASSMQQLLDWYEADGVVTSTVDFQRLVDFSLVDEASRQLGPYQ